MTNQTTRQPGYHHGLLQAGMLLFTIGLATGFVVPLMENPRMGLSSHLEGILNGLFLLGLGLLWPALDVGVFARRAILLLVVLGTFANWLVTLLAGLWGAGRAMPIAAAGHQGTAVQESIINALLFFLSGAMTLACLLILWGLRRPPASPAGAARSCTASEVTTRS